MASGCRESEPTGAHGVHAASVNRASGGSEHEPPIRLQARRGRSGNRFAGATRSLTPACKLGAGQVMWSARMARYAGHRITLLIRSCLCIPLLLSVYWLRKSPPATMRRSSATTSMRTMSKGHASSRSFRRRHLFSLSLCRIAHPAFSSRQLQTTRFRLRHAGCEQTAFVPRRCPPDLRPAGRATGARTDHENRACAAGENDPARPALATFQPSWRRGGCY